MEPRPNTISTKPTQEEYARKQIGKKILYINTVLMFVLFISFFIKSVRYTVGGIHFWDVLFLLIGLVFALLLLFLRQSARVICTGAVTYCMVMSFLDFEKHLHKEIIFDTFFLMTCLFILLEALLIILLWVPGSVRAYYHYNNAMSHAFRSMK